MNPVRVGVVVAEFEFVGFVEQGEAFYEAEASVHSGEAAALVVGPSGDDFEGKRGLFFDVEAQQGGV